MFFANIIMALAFWYKSAINSKRKAVSKMKLLVVLFLSAIVVASSIKKRPDLCYLTHSANTKDQSLCTSGGQNLWSFVSKANSCVEFYYYGCYGNDNRFFTKAQCEEVCQDKEGFSLLNIGASFG